MELIVFMGREDIKRQQLNVFRMELLGAKAVDEGAFLMQQGSIGLVMLKILTIY